MKCLNKVPRVQKSPDAPPYNQCVGVLGESVIDQLFSFKLTDGDLVLSSRSKLKTMFDCRKNT